MIRRINLWAPPSYGKTIRAMQWTVELTKLGYDVSYVSEHIKDKLMEGCSKPEPLDQVVILGNQFNRELRALRNYPLLITDSPLHLSSLYCLFYGGDSFIADTLTNIAKVLDRDYPALNVVLPKPPWLYKDTTRWQSEEEADRIQTLILEYLTENNLSYLWNPPLAEVVQKINIDKT